MPTLATSSCPKCNASISLDRILDGPRDAALTRSEARLACANCLSIVRHQFEPGAHLFADNGPWLDLDGDEVQKFLQQIGSTPSIAQYAQVRASYSKNLRWILRVPEVFNAVVGLHLKTVIFDAPAYFWVAEVKRDRFKDWQEFVGWSTPDIVELHSLEDEPWSGGAQSFLSSQATGNVCIHKGELPGLPPQLGLIHSTVMARVIGVNKQRLFLEPPSGPSSLLEWPQKKLCAGLDLLLPQLGP